MLLEVKELAAKYGVRYLETSTELCHNIDELLVEMTSIVRSERHKLFRSHRRSSVRMVSSLSLSLSHLLYTKIQPR